MTSWNAPERRTRRRCKTAALFHPLPSTTLKDRRGVYALIGKDEDRSQSLRRPSVRSKLQQASAEQKQPAAKKKDLEL